MPAPYQADPPVGNTNSPSDMADAIFFGWEGIFDDAGIQADIEQIIANGVNDLTDATLAGNVILQEISDSIAALLAESPLLRDRFAMSALEALGSDDTFAFSRTPENIVASVKTAYVMADLMLVERLL